MTDPSPLTTAFIVERPQAAATILSSLEPETAGPLIAALPGRIAGPAVAAMPPLNAAKCLSRMDTEKSTGILQNMPFQAAASILRIIVETDRKSILLALPRGKRREFLRSLHYPPDSVGAWMEQSIAPLKGAQNVAEALRYARQKDRPAGDKIFVVDDSQTYLGTVKIADLLLLDGKTLLSDVLMERSRNISSRSSLSVLMSDDSWSDLGSLAVLGRKGNLLGVITRQQVRNGLSAIRGTQAALSADAILPHLLAALVITLNAFVGLFTHGAGGPQPTAEVEIGNDR